MRCGPCAGDYEKSLEFMLSLGADILCEGHFGVYVGKDRVREFIEIIPVAGSEPAMADTIIQTLKTGTRAPARSFVLSLFFIGLGRV